MQFKEEESRYLQFIECPHCRRQYTISEIFLPDYLLGKTTDVIRNEDGQVEAFEGIGQDLKEEFTCEECNYTFEVKANISFETKVIESESFDNDYSTTIYKDRITLKEE